VIDADAVLAMADRVKRDLDRAFAHAGGQVNLSASVGIAMSDRDGDRPEDLLRTADAAMYRAKAASASRSGSAR
jgi:diguanylate cyclase (GGDEF)-like protein